MTPSNASASALGRSWAYGILGVTLFLTILLRFTPAKAWLGDDVMTGLMGTTTLTGLLLALVAIVALQFRRRMDAVIHFCTWFFIGFILLISLNAIVPL